MIYSLKMEPEKVQIPLIVRGSRSDEIERISAQWGFEVRDQTEYDHFILEVFEGRLQLRNCAESKDGPIYVDFISPATSYRRKFGGGKNQSIAKAVGIKKGVNPVIVDATCGLGRDAFVLASLGSRVHMIERSPVIAALLEDGLNRAKNDPEIGDWITERLILIFRDSRNALADLNFQPSTIYLDPMYPDRQKSALVKKEMRVFKVIVGDDPDAGELLEIALKTAKKRVVVKRPAYADCLAGQTPNISIKMRKNRFDIYLTQK